MRICTKDNKVKNFNLSINGINIKKDTLIKLLNEHKPEIFRPWRQKIKPETKKSTFREILFTNLEYLKKA
ncbi:hypothetical protein GVAV_000937 [Gurleya vavrai]